VLPGFLSVTSDPTAKDFRGAPLVGGYEVDDDGVPGQRVQLVEKGKLRNFCMSRIPTRKFKKSNGHSRNGRGAVSNLFLESMKRMPPDKLRERLVELAIDETLDYVYICRRMANPAISYLDPMGWYSAMMGRGGILLPPPILLYRLNIADGKETLVRGARFKKLELRVLRDIVATGDDEAAYIPLGQGEGEVSVVTPSLLIKEVEIGKPGREMEKLPSFPNPFFEKAAPPKAPGKGD